MSKVIVNVKVGEADRVNENGRSYTREVMCRELEKISDQNPVYGMPASYYDTGRVKMDKISHVVTGARCDDDGVILAEIKILDTVEGKKIQRLMGNNRVIFRPVGFGSISEEGVVGDDYRLSSFSVSVVSILPESER